MRSTLVLGIETSGTSTGLALADSGTVIAELVEDSNCSHNEALMPLLDRLLKGAGANVREISGIGVDIGPGMFTSLRVGTSTAKGLAVAHRIPVFGITSLWGLARTALPTMDGVLSLMDARKHQVYAALYLGGRPAIPPSLMSPEKLLSVIGKSLPGRTGLVAAGNGVGICAELLVAAGLVFESTDVDLPSPAVIAIEAGERIAKGQTDGNTSVEPLYLRRTDAELNREQKLGSKG